MLLASKLGLFLLLIFPFAACKKDADKVHLSKSPAKGSKIASNIAKKSKTELFAAPKQKKRWMPAFAAFGNRDTSDALGYDTQFPQDSAYGTAQDTMSYGNVGYGVDGNSYKDPSMSSAEVKPYTGEDTVTFEQEMASYLKPGIGDYPSDMPAGYKGDEGLGLVSSSHLKGNRFSPLSSFVTHQNAGFSLGKSKGESIADQMLSSSSLAPAKVTEPLKDHTTVGSTATSAAVAASSASAETEAATEKEAASLEKGEGGLDKSKHKPVIGARRQGAFYQLPSQASFEPIGLPQISPPNLYGSFNNALSAGLKGINLLGSSDGMGSDFAAANTPESPSALDIGENVNNKLASGSSFHKGPKDDSSDSEVVGGASDKSAKESEKLVKAKLVSTLRKALLKNIGEVMGKKIAGYDEGSGESEKSENTKDEKAKSREDSEDNGQETAKPTKTENAVKSSDQHKSGSEDDKEEQLESNLMKIDKKKLVHLLATFIRKNKQQFEEDSDEDEDSAHSGDKETAGTQTVMVQDISSKHLKSDDSKADAEETIKSAKQGKLEKQKYTGDEDEKKKKHASRTGHLAVDPYAQIGLVDPSNNDKLVLDSYSRHGLEKANAENNGNDKQSAIDKSKDEAFEKPKSSSHMKLKSKEAKAMKEAKTVSKEETKDETEEDDKKELEKLKQYAKEQREREELKEVQDEMERAKNKADDSTETSEREESKKIKSSKDREEKEDDQELKGFSNEEEKDSAKLSKEKLKKVKQLIDAASANFINPDIVKAIAAKLSGEAMGSKQSADDGKEKDDSEGVKEKAKEKFSKNDKEEADDTSEENSKEAASDNTTAASTDGPSIQRLIEHMKQRLQNTKPKETGKSKSKRGHSKAFDLDDAYAQIGAMDPNVRKKKTISRKHHIHRLVA